MSEDKNPYRKKRKKIISQLSDFTKEYTIDDFMTDLVKYFDGGVDFNIEKIRECVEIKGKLKELIEKAKDADTHPVPEFIREMLREIGKSGDIEWSGELE
jgi:hypothetical protein